MSVIIGCWCGVMSVMWKTKKMENPMYEDSKLITEILFNGKLNYFHNIEYEELSYVINRIKNVRIVELKDFTSEKANIDTKIIYFDHPDLLIVNSDLIIAVEHFKVNASKKTRKGYSYSQKYNNKYFEEKRITNQNSIVNDKDFSSITDKISTNLTYTNLFDNLIEVFLDHYNKIESYKNNIQSTLVIPSIKIYTVFFVEYDILFPSFIINDNVMKPVYPHNDIEFYSKLKGKDKMDGILFYQKGNTNQNEIKQYISLKGINANLYEVDNMNVYDFSKLEIHDFSNPMMNHFTVKI